MIQKASFLQKTFRLGRWSIAYYCEECDVLTFLDRAIGFAVEYTWDLFDFVAGLVGV